jgi:NAD(P)-dependent dehydrogenase (short-subunit alcohol dehydrogenase family)
MHSTDNPSLAGRVALITGANTGIGRVTARELARRGAHVLIACRTSARAQPVIDEIRGIAGAGAVECLPLDLGDLDSVRQCAQAFLARDLPLHLLINNAGLAGAHGLTRSGFELAFGTNHLGHFLLTQLLLERVQASAPARIVTVASRAHTRVDGIAWDTLRQPTRSKTGLPEYGVSKLANVLFSAELGRRLAGSGVTTYALHPGVVASDVWRSVPWPLRSLIKLWMITPEQGAATTLYCATAAAAAGETGLYYDKCRVKETSPQGRDAALAAELWRRSEEWVR